MQNCYKKGNRIPKELLEAQDGRLTTKHIQTLAFVQDVVRENKEMKAKLEEYEEHIFTCGEMHALAEESKNHIKDIHEKYMSRADEIRKELTEKHREELLQKVEENLKAEKDWGLEKQQLQAEVARQRSEIEQLNAQLASQLNGTKSSEDLLQELQQKIIGQETEIATLRANNAKLDEVKVNQLAEISRLSHVEAHNGDLLAEVKEVNQVNKELQFRVSKLERELGESGRHDTEEILLTLRNRLTKLHKEKSLWEEKEKQYIKQIEELKEENAKLRRALADSESMRENLSVQMEEILKEFDRLKRHSSHERDKQSFKDFVALKRDLQHVRHENDELKTMVKLATGGKGRIIATLPSVYNNETTTNGGAGDNLVVSNKAKERRKSAYADLQNGSRR